MLCLEQWSPETIDCLARAKERIGGQCEEHQRSWAWI